MRLAFANTTPSRAIEVDAIDEPAQHGRACRFVAVHIIERISRVEAAFPTQAYPVAQASRCFQEQPRGAPHDSRWRHRSRGLRQSRVLSLVRWRHCLGRGLVERLENEFARMSDRPRTLAL